MVAVVLFWQQEKDELISDTPTAQNMTPAWIIEKPVIEHFDNEGTLIGRIQANGMQYQQELELTSFQSPILEQGKNTSEGRQLAWRATAMEAKTTNLSQQIDLIGDVNVYNLLQRYHLKTAELNADSVQRILRTDTSSTLTGPNSAISAGSVVANWVDETIDLSNDVQVTITPR